MLDVVGALLALTWCMPLLAVCAAAVRIETPGPVFYSQDRIGFRRRRFRVWKIRTMQIDAEVDGVPQWSKANDDRITRVGAFLRRCKIDEIPQFYNVLKGDMSMIGPRPERPEFVEYLEQHIPYYKIRHSVKPGISGWAQINFPYASTIEQTKRKLEYDLYYIKNYSLLLDVIVVLQTLRVILWPEKDESKLQTQRPWGHGLRRARRFGAPERPLPCWLALGPPPPSRRLGLIQLWLRYCLDPE